MLNEFTGKIRLVGVSILVVGLVTGCGPGVDHGSDEVAAAAEDQIGSSTESEMPKETVIQSAAGTKLSVPEDIGVDGFVRTVSDSQWIDGVDGWQAGADIVDDSLIYEAGAEGSFLGSYVSIKVSSSDPELTSLLNSDFDPGEVADVLRFPRESVSLLPVGDRRLVQIAPAEVLSGDEFGVEDRIMNLWLYPTADGRSIIFIGSDSLTGEEAARLIGQNGEEEE